MCIKLYNVVGTVDYEDVTFCRCTTFAKAAKAKSILEKNGYDCIDIEIEQDEIPIDFVDINSELLEL